jgi:hypothetical protein
MNTFKSLWMAAAVMASLTCLQAMGADETAQKAREILKQHQGSMVSVSALAKMVECMGTVVDPSGLTVVSYFALNPMEAMGGRMRISMGAEDGDNGPEIKPKNSLSRVQIHTADGKDIQARVVFKDKELDMAFIMPVLKEGEKAPEFSAIKLADGGAAKELDEVVVLWRHAKNLGYQPAISLARISSVITKPRLLYDLTNGGSPGGLVFGLDGHLIGITIVMSGGGSELTSAPNALITPAAEVLKMLAQAKEAAAKKTKDDE